MPDVPKRLLIAVGTAEPGDKTRLPALPSVRADLRRMRELFVRELGYEDMVLAGGPKRTPEAARAEANLDLSAEEIRSGLLEIRQRIPSAECEAVVFYFSGHALAIDGELRLCTRGFADPLAASGLEVRAIAAALDRAAPKIWIVLDVCSAAAGAEALVREAAHAMNQKGTSLWFLASSGGRASSYENRFSTAFVAAARACPRPYDAFVASLQSDLDRAKIRQRAHQLSAGSELFDLLGDEPAAAVPAHTPGARASRVHSALIAGGAAAFVLAAALALWAASNRHAAEPKPHSAGPQPPAAEIGSVASGGGPAALDPSALYRKSFAVVVGIDAYAYMDRLRGAVRDAKTVANALRAQRFEVTTLLDGEATFERMREVLGDGLRQQLGPDDRVLVYFAGHGVSVGEQGAQVGYLMPVQAESYKPFTTGISMIELMLWLDSYPSKHVMFIADACYSGLAIGTRGLALGTRGPVLSPRINGYVDAIASRKVRFGLVAGAEGEDAHEWDNQGVFTRFLLEGMAGSADANRDALVTGDELASYVCPQVAEFVRTRYGASQLPQSARAGSGAFIFFTDQRPPVAPSALSASTGVRQQRTVAHPEPPSSAPALAQPREPDPAVELNPIGIWNGADGRSLRIQREGKKTIAIGRDPERRFYLGLIRKSRHEAEFEGAGRLLSDPEQGSFVQVVVVLSAIDAYTARYQATIQTLDASGLPIGAATIEAPLEVRYRPGPVAKETPLALVGSWEGGEDRRATITDDGDGAVIACTDRWGAFTARTRLWTDTEAVFEGTGEMAAGPRKGTPFRVAVRLKEAAPDVLDYEPIIQYLDAKGAPTGASLLGYTWSLKRTKVPAAP